MTYQVCSFVSNLQVNLLIFLCLNKIKSEIVHSTFVLLGTDKNQKFENYLHHFLIRFRAEVLLSSILENLTFFPPLKLKAQNITNSSHENSCKDTARWEGLYITVCISYFSTAEQPNSIKYLFYLLTSYQVKWKRNLCSIVVFQNLIVFQKHKW